jgi:uncharacterized protein (TIGR00296 family)
MDENDGDILVGLARKAISEYLRNKKIISPPENVRDELNENRGVFVTLSTYPENRLRGCIGIPEPVKPLLEAVIEAAISAATNDPRFSPLSPQELHKITIEVTVLTPPEIMGKKAPKECLELIEIGRHGLIIEKGWCRGLLLPQVPVEQGWDKEEYLAGLCMKAGLSVEAWMETDTKLYCFEGVIFSEEQPMGSVKKRESMKE